MNEYNICGVVIHARSDRQSQVEAVLQKQRGVEIHASSEQGKLVVTVESEDSHYVADTIEHFKDIDGVLSASMIFSFAINRMLSTRGYPHEINQTRLYQI